MLKKPSFISILAFFFFIFLSFIITPILILVCRTIIHIDLVYYYYLSVPAFLIVGKIYQDIYKEIIPYKIKIKAISYYFIILQLYSHSDSLNLGTFLINAFLIMLLSYMALELGNKINRTIFEKSNFTLKNSILLTLLMFTIQVSLGVFIERAFFLVNLITGLGFLFKNEIDLLILPITIVVTIIIYIHKYREFIPQKTIIKILVFKSIINLYVKFQIVLIMHIDLFNLNWMPEISYYLIDTLIFYWIFSLTNKILFIKFSQSNYEFRYKSKFVRFIYLSLIYFILLLPLFLVSRIYIGNILILSLLVILPLITLPLAIKFIYIKIQLKDNTELIQSS